MNIEEFKKLIAKYARVETANEDDLLFGSGLDISSIAYTEFVLELEEIYDLDIDLDKLDASTTTVLQLYQGIFAD